MKKHIIIALIIFVVVSWGIYSLYYDETPLEQNFLIGYSMLIGIIAISPIVFLTRTLHFDFGLFNLTEAGTMFYFALLPFIGGFFWSTMYLLLVGLMRKIKKAIDPKPSNFMYAQEQGFSVLDYHLKNSVSKYGLAQEIIDLRHGLTARKFEPLDYEAPDYEEKVKAQAIEKYKISLPTMVRFLGILKEKYPNILAEWQRQRDEDKKNPSMSVSDLIDRRYIPEHPDLAPHLKKLEEMGF